MEAAKQLFKAEKLKEKKMERLFMKGISSHSNSWQV